jgi:hypothetical protein
MYHTEKENSLSKRAACEARLLVTAAILLTLAACGGGGGGTSASPEAPPTGSSPPPAPPPPPASPAVTVPTDLPVLFIEVSEDISVFNDVIGDVIEGNLQNFIQFVPATGELALVATNRSVSYSESISTFKVFSDRAFVVNVSDTGARVVELNLDSMLEPPASVPVPTPLSQDSISDSCLAVIGDDLIYKVAHRRAPAPATGFEDGPLVRIPDFFSAAGPGAMETLMPGLSDAGTSASPGGFVTDACRGYFDADGSSWFDTEIGFADGSRDFFRKDLLSAEPTLIASLRDQAPVLVSEHAYDEDTVYFAGLDVTNQVFTIASALLDTLVVDTTLPIRIEDYVDAFSATGLFLLDADDGYVAFVFSGTDRDVLMLYEPVSGLIEAFDFGTRINQMQLIFRGS